MDLSWESFYAQFPGLHSPAGCDGFDVDLFFEKNDKTKKNNKDAVLEEYVVPDNALVYMEETLDLDKLTELSSLTSKDISNETHMVVEIPNEEVKPPSSLSYYNYDETNNVQRKTNKSLHSTNDAVVKKPVLCSNNPNLLKLADVLPPDSEEFLQNLLYESEANTITSAENCSLIETLTPPSPLAVVPSTPVQNESDDESNITPTSPKQRILLPKGTIAYTLDLIPGTNTYMVTESRVPVPENTDASVAGTLSNNDLLALGMSNNSYFSGKMEDTTALDSLEVPYPSAVATPPNSEVSWSGSNSLQVSYPSPSPSPSTSSGSDTEWMPSSSEWVETRGTPYGRRSKRSPEERKMRKMEQNKTAALRYRKKKHQEMNKAQIERDELVAKNEVLKKTASDLSTELKYIKKLLKEVCQAKGLLD